MCALLIAGANKLLDRVDKLTLSIDMRNLPPLTAVRAFEAAGRHENFTAAAEELGMTQAAVSHQIRALEDRIGQRLFHRIRRRVELNEMGRRLLPQVTGALDQLELAFGEVKQADENLLTVSASSTFSHLWLAGRLGLFQMQHPGLALRLLASDQLVNFSINLEVDVAIRSGYGRWEGIHQELLVPLDFTPMCSPTFLDMHGSKIDPQRLHELPRINAEETIWSQWFEQAGIPLDDDAGAGRLRLDSHVNEGRAAIADQGIAMLSPFLWRDSIAEGKLVDLFPSSSVKRESYGYWLVCPEHRLHAPKVARFRKWIRDQLA